MSLPQPRKSEVVSIQQLRGLAAMLVVFEHANASTGWLFAPFSNMRFGTAGVDIFFVISGFIMYVAARRERVGEFLVKRAIRVIPLYWIATLLLVALRMPHFGETDLTVVTVTKSLLFVPYRADPAQAQIFPVLVPGWSLNIEMFFYALFAAGLTMRRPAWFSAIAIVAAVAIGSAVKPVDAIPFTYTRAILLEFVIGLALAWAYKNGRLAQWMGIALPIGALLILSSDYSPINAAVARALGGICMVVGALAFEVHGVWAKMRLATMIGDASYSIYLFHDLVLMPLRKVMPHVPLNGWPQYLLFMAATYLSVIAVGYAIFRLVEKRITDSLRNAFLPPRQAVSVLDNPTKDTQARQL